MAQNADLASGGVGILPAFQGVVSEIQDAVLASSGVEGFQQRCGLGCGAK